MKIVSAVCQFLKSLIVAFSIYSKIPVPRFNWASDDMKYHLCFFPWVGAVIGAAEWGWFNLYFKVLTAQAVAGGNFASNNLFFALIAFVIPVLITGGFHLDGFLDTMDALHSYGDRQKKLEILKDPHVGAFAVISFSVYILLALAFLSLVKEKSLNLVISVCFSFYISRCLSGLSVLIFPKARSDGMLATESKTKSSLFVIVILCIQLLAGLWAMSFLAGIKSLIPFAAILLCFLYYYSMSKKHFGGISGDLAGFYVCIAELTSLVSSGICYIL